MKEQDARQAHYEMLRSWGLAAGRRCTVRACGGTWAQPRPRTEAQQEVEAG